MYYGKIYKNDLVKHQYIDLGCLIQFYKFNGRYNKDKGKQATFISSRKSTKKPVQQRCNQCIVCY